MFNIFTFDVAEGEEVHLMRMRRMYISVRDPCQEFGRLLRNKVTNSNSFSKHCFDNMALLMIRKIFRYRLSHPSTSWPPMAPKRLIN